MKASRIFGLLLAVGFFMAASVPVSASDVFAPDAAKLVADGKDFQKDFRKLDKERGKDFKKEMKERRKEMREEGKERRKEMRDKADKRRDDFRKGEKEREKGMREKGKEMREKVDGKIDDLRGHERPGGGPEGMRPGEAGRGAPHERPHIPDPRQN